MERIILTRNVNETDFLRTLARYEINSFGLRVLNAVGLAKYVRDYFETAPELIEKLLSKEVATQIIFALLKSNEECYTDITSYFKYVTYKDATNILNTINDMRMMIDIDPLAEDPRVEEIEEVNDFLCNSEYINLHLYDVYKAYTDYKAGYFNFDGTELGVCTDSIDYIRQAKSLAQKMDVEIILLDEEDYTPLELGLVNQITDNVIHKSIKDFFFDIEGESKELTFVKTYGKVNEIEYIVKDIKEHKYSLDDCLIVAPSIDQYGVEIATEFEKYGIPYTTDASMNIMFSNPYRMERDIIYYAERHFPHDGFLDIIHSNYFHYKKFIHDIGLDDEKYKAKDVHDCLDILAYLRMDIGAGEAEDDSIHPNLDRVNAIYERFDESRKEFKELVSKYENINQEELIHELVDSYEEHLIKYKDILLKAAKIFDKEYNRFVDRYCIIRKNSIDDSALKSQREINHLFNDYLDYCDINNEDLLQAYQQYGIPGKAICPGAIHCCSLSKAPYLIRKHVYILGMNSEFPGTAKEDYLISDEHYTILGDKAPTSSRKNQITINKFLNFIDLCSYLKADLTISYPYFSLSDVRKLNASSLLYKIYNDKHPGTALSDFNKIFKVVDFKHESSLLNNLIYKYNQGIEINPVDFKQKPYKNTIDYIKDKSFSPSQINTYFECPREFYLKNILYFKKENEVNSYQLLDARNKGTMMHCCLYYRSLTNCSKEEFIKVFDILFKNYLSYRPYYTEADENEPSVMEIKDSLELYYDNTPTYPTLVSEEDIRSVHLETGINIHGFPDNVENNGGYLQIIDYKTGNKVAHKPNDIDTCLQTVLYCYILEHSDLMNDPSVRGISGSEYRYIMKHQVVKCDYDDNMKDELKEKLEIFKQALVEGQFENCEKCPSYCPFKELCGRKEEPSNE